MSPSAFKSNSFGSEASLEVDGVSYVIHDLRALKARGFDAVERLPYSQRLLLENLLRHEDGHSVTADHITTVAGGTESCGLKPELLFRPARVLMQDHTGLAALVDLAAMRDAVDRLGGDPSLVNPLRPTTVVIDHSVQVDSFGQARSLQYNIGKEIERNRERYEFFKWAQGEMPGLKVVPPGTGICHQVNLELLGQVVWHEQAGGVRWAYPDTVVGTDSHTPMINGLSILGWGVGGIEAAAVMLGQPISMLMPDIVGVRLSGSLRPGVTMTDLVLTVTELLRRTKVVGKFVEFCGPGLDTLSVPDRATIANMCPEYGATVGYFPIDQRTIDYLKMTHRPAHVIGLVEAYARRQGLFRAPGQRDPEYSQLVALDLGTVEPSIAGPRLPQQRIALRDAKQRIQEMLAERPPARPGKAEPADPQAPSLRDGAVVLAAITSCTNTSNPSSMLMAGLLARNAVRRGVGIRPWVKASLSPGSRAVSSYLQASGLLPYLEALRFHVVGYGCMTCIGNSGPLVQGVEEAVRAADVWGAAVLSGNRNFENRIHPGVRMNFLASPAMVIAYAIAGQVDIDFEHEPLADDADGEPVYLRELWPDAASMDAVMGAAVDCSIYRHASETVWLGEPGWQSLQAARGQRFAWPESSTYLKPPPHLEHVGLQPPALQDIRGARVLALLGDSVTTDHISPAGTIDPAGDAGRYLLAHGVLERDFNTFSTRRGNHEVMLRGAFANPGLANRLVPGRPGPWTRLLPGGEITSIFEASRRYTTAGVPLLLIAGHEYGTGSSRDWAAKVTRLLGIRAVLAQSFERIHRSNLVGMGVLPLQFEGQASAESLGLDGSEVFDIESLADGIIAQQRVLLRARRADGREILCRVVCRVDTPVEAEYLAHGGILPFMLRRLIASVPPQQ